MECFGPEGDLEDQVPASTRITWLRLVDTSGVPSSNPCSGRAPTPVTRTPQGGEMFMADVVTTGSGAPEPREGFGQPGPSPGQGSS